MKSSVDNKSVMSSLSAEAAEFVPQNDLQKQGSSAGSSSSGKPQQKLEMSVEVTEVPRYLTSCFPFVSPEDVNRHRIPRFPQQFSYSGGTQPSLPMPFTPPIRFPAWQALKPGLVGNFQPVSYTSVPYDPLTVPVDVPGVRGDCLLLPQSKIGMSAPPLLGQGVLLAPRHDPVTSWVMSVPPPLILQQQQYQQHLHSSQQQQQQAHLTAATKTAYLDVPSSASKDDKLKMKVDSASQKEAQLEARPPSPVLISRSSQTDLPVFIHNFTLEEKPHPLYVSPAKQNESAAKGPDITCDGHELKGENEDSDSGYSSPMQKQNLVSSGIQAVPSKIPLNNSRHAEDGQGSVKSQKDQGNCLTNQDAKIGGKYRAEGKQNLRSGTGSSFMENVEVGGKKKWRKRDVARPVRSLGSNTKALSRSSSSVSSSGTKPEEEDEKIDLHSWTDFPPMSTRATLHSAMSRPMHNKSPMISDECVPLTIERSAHEPPWSIKFSSADQVRSERSRSSSGEKERSLMSPPESAWGKIGRSFKNSQSSGAGVDLSSLISTSETMPLLSSAGKSGDGGVPGNTGSDKFGPGSKRSSAQTGRSKAFMNRTGGSERGEYKSVVQSSSQARSKTESQNVTGCVEQNKESNTFQGTAVCNTKLASSSVIQSPVSLFSTLSRPPPAVVTVTTATVSSVCFAGGITTISNAAAASCYKNEVLVKNGSYLKTNSSGPFTSPRTSFPVSRESKNIKGTVEGTDSAGSSCIGIRSDISDKSTNSVHMGTANSDVQPALSSVLGSLSPRTLAAHPAAHGALSAADLSSCVNSGSVMLNQPVLSSASSALSLQQPASFLSHGVVPSVPIRPNLQRAASAVNYHIPPPSQTLSSVPPGGGLHQSPKFNSYLNVAQGSLSMRMSSPGFLPKGTPSQAVHPVAPPYPNGAVPFIPPPLTFDSSTPFSYHMGAVPPQSYQPNGPSLVSSNPQQLAELLLQSPGSSVANVLSCSQPLKSLDLNMPSMTLSGAQHPNSGNCAYSVSPVSKMSDIRTVSAGSGPLQQHSLEQRPSGNADGALNSKDVEGDEKRRRRRRRKRTKRSGKDVEEKEGEGGCHVLESAVSNSNISESTLHFEDMDEFPDLLHSSSASVHVEDVGAGERSALSGTSVTYSDILKSAFSKAGSQSRTQSLTGSCVSGDMDDEDNASCQTGATSESKRARRRRKRREQANKAAEVELAEISLEQQWLKEVGLKKSASHRTDKTGATSALNAKSMPGLITQSSVVNEAKKQTSGKSGNKKSQQPIAFDIAAMIDAIQKKPEAAAAPSLTKSYSASQSVKASKKQWERTSSLNSTSPGTLGNILDSTAATQKRGKEREIGKTKKPSPLKKVILKEREQRKRLRLLDEDPDSATALGTVGSSTGVGIAGGESELSQDALSNKSEDTDGGGTNGAGELSADFSPISQTSPISMSPASPGNSGVNSPVTGSIGRDPVVMKIHSRRFREYCTQILDKEIDECCTSLLQDLVKFQDRMYHKDPVKAKTKRRVVLGLREVTKHLKLKKIKCVVISPNLEKIQSKGGLDEALNNILNMCREQDVPFVFALGRRALGRACAKLVPVSVVGIFNYEGCESKYRSLISLTAAARTAYNEMVLAVEKEVAEYPTMASQTSSIGGVPGLFAAHMGHSRTPSGCSAISFTSSILSEPISENFPHAEPEVDSKGYEIVRDAAGNVVHPSGSGAGSKGCLNLEIDDGNEADTEDFGETRRKRRGGRPLNSVRFGDMGGINAGSKDAAKDFISKEKSVSVCADFVNDDVDERNSIGKLSRNVSELTLTNEDNFILKGEPYSLKHKSCLREFDDDNGEFDDEKDESGDGTAEQEKTYGSVGLENNKWTPVAHIDSIHSQNYNLGDEILSHHSPRQQETGFRGQCMISTRHSQSPPSHLSVVCSGDGRQKIDFNNGDAMEPNDDEIEDPEEEEDEEDEDETSKRHHRVIDKERIKNWLASQSNISNDD